VLLLPPRLLRGERPRADQRAHQRAQERQAGAGGPSRSDEPIGERRGHGRMVGMRTGIVWAVAALLCSAPGWSAEAVEYHFAPGDVIEVTVAPQHAFDRTITVQPDGKISFPVVGPLQAGG